MNLHFEIDQIRLVVTNRLEVRKLVWSSSARNSGAEKVKRIESAFAAVRKGTATATLVGDLWTVTSGDGTVLFSENITEARKVDIAKRSIVKVETEAPKSYGAASDSDIASESVSAPAPGKRTRKN